MKSIILAAAGLVSVLMLALFILSGTRSYTQPHAGSVATRLGKRKPKDRIAIVIPFFGENPEAIPPFLNLFTTAAAGSASLVDFFLVHNGALEAYTEPVPSNVKFVNVGSTEAFAELLMRVVDRRSDLAFESRERLLRIVTIHIKQYPYVLVEFKPATGHIFADMLQGYSHWGYADLDIAFGDLPRWITKEELTDFDIVTYGYGDQNRVYLRGQFTFHKNIDRVNQLWRECSYLSSMDERFAQVMSGKKKLRVESAEGCYSAAILKQRDIRVKYAVKAFNDIDEHDTVNTHGLYIGIGANRDRSVIYKAGSQEDGKALLRLPPNWFEHSDNVYGAKEKPPLQKQVGKRQLVPKSTPVDTKCMYWVPESYQSDICISGVQKNETLFWIDGELYKQAFENANLPGNVVSRPFFHFQEWKRYYRAAQLATVHHSTEALGWVLVGEGAIPIFSRDLHARGWAAALAHSPLGLNMVHWSTADNSNRKMLPHARYCFRSGPRKFPPQPKVSTCFDSISWQDQERVEILHGAPVWKHIDVKREVTLALTLQITPKQIEDIEALDGILDIAIANIKAWQGQPCVLVMHMAGATAGSVSRVRSRFAALDTDASLVAMISQEELDLVSRKALLNMASDAAPTRWVVSGVEVERGLVLSTESSALAYRQANIHSDSSGTVLVIPQFAIKDDEDDRIDLSFNDLSEMRRTGEPVVYGPDEFEDPCEDDEQETDSVLRPVHKLWWKLSTKETTGDYVPNDDTSLHELALALDDMQLSFIRLLTKENEMELFSLNSSPILMTDSVGPHKGMRTSELVREIEEFGGKQCFNALRLAQLAALGYNIDVLTKAFAVSTSGSRHAAFDRVTEDTFGASRCDGCFMFDEDHERILKEIAEDERRRPPKASILWEDMRTSPSFS